jgi:hypothetical protein
MIASNVVRETILLTLCSVFARSNTFSEAILHWDVHVAFFADVFFNKLVLSIKKLRLWIIIT